MTDTLSLTFFALADPTRREILHRLKDGPAPVKSLLERVALSAPAVTKHLKVLERAGLVRRGKDAQWRPCELDAAPLKEVAGYLDQYRANWETRFDALGDYLNREDA